jgi:signal transduction histidine kinase
MHLPPDNRGKNNIILIIDDARHNLLMLGNLLEMNGYEVLVATSGTEALDIVKKAPLPNLIMLDILMPDLNGFEVCQRLKADPTLRSIPVIFISSIDDTDQKLRAFRAGAVDYITKPFQSEEVLARVNTHLQLGTIEELIREIDERKRTEMALQYSQDKLSVLADELRLTEERERRRIAVALHDQVVQKLALGKLKLDQAIKNGLVPSEAAVTDLLGILEGSMRDLQELSTDLSPPLLYEMGLKSAIADFGERLAKDHGISIVISGEEGLELREDVRVSLFQMARELLINMVKHSKASSTTVQLSTGKKSVCLEVVDNGVGFDLPTCCEGFGHTYIRQRISFLGGTMKIFTAPDMGTSIIIEIPTIN